MFSIEKFDFARAPLNFSDPSAFGKFHRRLGLSYPSITANSGGRGLKPQSGAFFGGNLETVGPRRIGGQEESRGLEANLRTICFKF